MSVKYVMEDIQNGSNIINNAGNTVSDVNNNIQNGASTVSDIIASITSVPGVLSDTVNNAKETASSTIKDAKETASKIKSMSDTIKNTSVGDIGKNITEIVPATAQALLSEFDNSATSLMWPDTLKNVSLNPGHINFQFFELDENNQEYRSTSINLPMPDDVKNPSTINWDNGTDFGMMGDAVVKGIKSIKNGSATTEGVQEQMHAMVERVKSLAFYTGMSNVVSAAGGNASANDLMGASSNKMPNPYKTMLFRGVDFRKFNFTFFFVPFSEKDCSNILKIIEKFRYHSYPAFAADKMFFTFPDECQITYMWESSPNKWLNNFKRSVCTAIEVDYCANGMWSPTRNGFPNLIKITTTWTETQVLTKEDITTANNTGQKS